MPCSCQQKKEQFGVVTNGGTGRQVYASSDKALAVKVSVRYPGSVVKDGSGTVVHRNDPPATAPQVNAGSTKETAG
jgi:hypothetical protein